MSRAKNLRRGNGDGTEPKLHKSGLFEIQLSFGFKPDGKRDRRSVYGKTKEETRKKRDALQHEYNQGKISSADTIRFGQWLDKWLEGRKPHIAVSTYELYKHRINRWIPERLKQLRLQAVKRGDIRDLLTYVATLGLSGGERSRLLQHITSALEEAIDRELIAVNPARGMKVKATQAEEAKGLKKTQIALPENIRDMFLDAAVSDPLYPVLYTMFSLGLRRGEALGLSWLNVNFSTGTIHICQQVRVENNKAVIGILKTKKSKRTLKASDDLLEVLRQRKVTQMEHQRILGASWTDTGLAFTTQLGTAIQPRNLNRTISRICKIAGIANFGSHSARKTFITDLLRDGANLEVVSSIAGHSRPSITSDIYRTVREDEMLELTYSIAGRREKARESAIN